MAGSEAAPDGSVNSSSLSALGKEKDGPVLSMMNKRLRALKKKYNRILQIEESKGQGKVINKEQEDVLRSKVSVLILMDEYEKLKQPLSQALGEEIEQREKELAREISHKHVVFDDGNSNREDEKKEEVNGGGVVHARNEEDVEDANERLAEGEPGGFSDEAIAELLKVLYFANLFHVVSQNEFVSMTWTRVHERSSCLSYDYVTDDATMPLREEDLNALAHFGSLMTARPPNATLSHKTALENCVHHATQWLASSSLPIQPDQGHFSYSDLRERLNRILSSEYFTMTPELQTVSEHTAAAAASAAGQYATQVLVHENSSEGQIYQTDVSTPYYIQEHQSDEEQKLYQSEEYNATPANVGTGDSLDSGGEVIQSAPYGEQNDTSFEGSHSDENQIPGNLSPTLEQDESHADPLHSQLQVPQENQQHSGLQGHQHLDQESKDSQQHLENEHRENQQQKQYYSQNGGPSRGYQSQRGGRGMGYGSGRGRGYINGRGGRPGRGGGYSNGRGQYFDQGNYYRRNYNSGRGRGRKSGEMMYNHASGSPQVSAMAQTN